MSKGTTGGPSSETADPIPGVPSPFFPGILLSKKPLGKQLVFVKRMMVEKNGTMGINPQTPRPMASAHSRAALTARLRASLQGLQRQLRQRRAQVEGLEAQSGGPRPRGRPLSLRKQTPKNTGAPWKQSTKETRVTCVYIYVYVYIYIQIYVYHICMYVCTLGRPHHLRARRGSKALIFGVCS